MATRGGRERLFELVGETGRENTQVQQALLLFGFLSVVGGVGLFVLTETVRFEPGALHTVRRAAVGLAGFGLPAFLHGLVLETDEGAVEAEVGALGAALSALAVLAFFAGYPGTWSLATDPIYVTVTLAVYGLGAMLSSFAAGGAMLAGGEDDEDAASEAETGFIWGDPPDG